LDIVALAESITVLAIYQVSMIGTFCLFPQTKRVNGRGAQ